MVAFFVEAYMSGVQAIVEAARRELGDELANTPTRASCPGCGKFLLALLTKPSLARGHCDRCNVDVVVYVAKNGEVMIATDRRR